MKELKFLIVDDSPVMRDIIIRGELEGAGVEKKNIFGAENLSKVASHCSQMIFIITNSKFYDGLIKEVLPKSKIKNIPVVVYGEEDKDSFVGLRGFVEKSLITHQLIQKIDEVILHLRSNK